MVEADSFESEDDWRGIHLTRGMNLQLSGLTFYFNDDGTVDTPDIQVRVSINLYVYWLEIAWRHLSDATAAHAALRSTWEGDDAEAKSEALEQDFAASMQCVVAAAVAVDAFYAMVRDFVPIADRTRQAWSRNRTPRPKRIAEVLRRSFKIGPNSFKAMRGYLIELFAWRDKSVHPQAGYDVPVRYDELKVATEWRFVAFRADNAKAALGIALGLIAQLVDRPQDKHEGLSEHCASARQFVAPLVAHWEAEYGQLYARDDAGSA
jgi:hypothetical protein